MAEHHSGSRSLHPLRLRRGLIPSCAKDPSAGSKDDQCTVGNREHQARIP